MYGSVMVGRLAVPFEEAEKVARAWEDERAPKVKGWLGTVLLLGNDGKTLVMGARFEDKAAYDALADDPEQDRWWSEGMAPLLEGEPQWIDGTWTQ